VLLLGLAVVLVPVLVAILDVRVVLPLPTLLLILVLGCLAIAAPGTLHGAIASHARARDVLLPLLLFPILIPALVAAAKSTALVFDGDPMDQVPGWLGLLGGFDLLYWALGFALFPRVVEE
jgi:heme exporter protein B